MPFFKRKNLLLTLAFACIILPAHAARNDLDDVAPHAGGAVNPNNVTLKMSMTPETGYTFEALWTHSQTGTQLKAQSLTADSGDVCQTFKCPALLERTLKRQQDGYLYHGFFIRNAQGQLRGIGSLGTMPCMGYKHAETLEILKKWVEFGCVHPRALLPDAPLDAQGRVQLRPEQALHKDEQGSIYPGMATFALWPAADATEDEKDWFVALSTDLIVDFANLEGLFPPLPKGPFDTTPDREVATRVVFVDSVDSQWLPRCLRNGYLKHTDSKQEDFGEFYPPNKRVMLVKEIPALVAAATAAPQEDEAEAND